MLVMVIFILFLAWHCFDSVIDQTIDWAVQRSRASVACAVAGRLIQVAVAQAHRRGVWELSLTHSNQVD